MKFDGTIITNAICICFHKRRVKTKETYFMSLCLKFPPNSWHFTHFLLKSMNLYHCVEKVRSFETWDKVVNIWYLRLRFRIFELVTGSMLWKELMNIHAIWSSMAFYRNVMIVMIRISYGFENIAKNAVYIILFFSQIVQSSVTLWVLR